MSSLRTFSIGTTMKILLPSVAIFLLAFPVLAQNDSSNYVFLLASGFLCDPGDSSTCPARAKANQGDSYEAERCRDVQCAEQVGGSSWDLRSPLS